MGLKAILTSRCSSKPWLGTDDFGYRVCPLINVAGRIDSAQRAIDLFQCRDPQKALGLVKELEELNRKRQTLQSGVEAEARSRHQEGGRLLVAYDPNWHHGVVGPAAGRLSEELNIPVILGGYASELKSYAFSGRSRGGVHLYETLKKALSGVEVNFGGHKAAIGMKIPEDQVAKITEILRERSDLIIPDPARVSREYAAQLRPSSIQIAHWKEVNSLEPYGPDNEAPTFMVRDAELELRRSSYRPHDAYGVGKGRDENNVVHQFPVIVHDSPQLSAIASTRGHLFGRLFLERRPTRGIGLLPARRCRTGKRQWGNAQMTAQTNTPFQFSELIISPDPKTDDSGCHADKARHHSHGPFGRPKDVTGAG